MYFLLVLLVPLTIASDCPDCVGSGKSWCYETSACQLIHLGCKTVISDSYKCPRAIQNGSEYDDDFARNTALPYIAAAYAGNPYLCLQNQVPSTKLEKLFIVSCPNNFSLPSTCTAITAVDSTKKAIVVSFKGSADTQQIIGQMLAVLQPPKKFFDHGYVFRYFYDAFLSLWNGGLKSSVEGLKAANPDYELWAFGHSLGAAEASVFASYVVETGIYSPDKIKLVTFGTPRTGTLNFVKWHDETFPYSYRVTHKSDAIARLPPFTGPLGYWHHRYEVWYNNDMTAGSDYNVCPFADGFTCSNEITNWLGYSWDDHNVYFTKNLAVWAADGCPKN